MIDSNKQERRGIRTIEKKEVIDKWLGRFMIKPEVYFAKAGVKYTPGGYFAARRAVLRALWTLSRDELANMDIPFFDSLVVQMIRDLPDSLKYGFRLKLRVISQNGEEVKAAIIKEVNHGSRKQ